MQNIASKEKKKKGKGTTKILTVFFSRLAGGGCCGVGTMMGGEGGYTVCPE